MAQATRVCTSCKIDKPESAFPPRKPSKPNVARRQCRECINAQERRRKAGNDKHRQYILRYRASRRDWVRSLNLKQKYGLLQADYDRMFAEQNGVCAICKGPQSKAHKDGSRWLDVDHDHATNTPRALLCHRCNIGLGKFKDSPELLRAAAAYIEFHRQAVPQSSTMIWIG